jgi:hypothetical protein|tara:strand:- start:101 stop:274 length:174 start_codon:yes stop_codon:yes gene_type:complete
MREVKLSDPYATVVIRMCEKHFANYRRHMDDAYQGGTSYSYKRTNKRGCELCKKEKK